MPHAPCSARLVYNVEFMEYGAQGTAVIRSIDRTFFPYCTKAWWQASSVGGIRQGAPASDAEGLR